MVALGVAVLSALLAPQLAPYSPVEGDLIHRLEPPIWAGGDADHLLGTDHLGRDVLSRIIWGGRVSLVVGFVGMPIAASLGVALGVTSGYFGGLLDDLIMRAADVQFSLPFLALAIAVVAVIGPGLTNVILVLGIGGWILFARVVRAQLLVLRQQEFVLAARAIGAGNLRIMIRHLLPNLTGGVIVVAASAFSHMVLTEASISFLGLGVQPPTATWGGMLNDSRDYIGFAGWLATLPGLALLAVVLSVNTLGDRLRDRLDPRQRVV